MDPIPAVPGIDKYQQLTFKKSPPSPAPQQGAVIPGDVAKEESMRIVRLLAISAILLAFVFTGSGWGDDLSGLKICLDPGLGAYPSIKPFETLH